MEQKKFSFGFSKIIKPNNFTKKDDKKNEIELIKCLEGQTIKLVVEKEPVVVNPLVIPIKGFAKTSDSLASIREKKDAAKHELKKHLKLNSSLSSLDEIEQKAVRELIEEADNKLNSQIESPTFVAPIVPADELPLNGEAESTLDDYENVPISQFGKALLRGMGWKEETSKKSELIDDSLVPRPKGMGLGADKSLQKRVQLIPPAPNEVLEIKKHAYVKIIGGKHNNLYGQIEGFDDLAGRIIIKFALGGLTDALNEFLVQPVSKKEYNEYGKVINSLKYNEYKKRENDANFRQIKKEKSDSEKNFKKENRETNAEKINIEKSFLKIENQEVESRKTPDYYKKRYKKEDEKYSSSQSNFKYNYDNNSSKKNKRRHRSRSSSSSSNSNYDTKRHKSHKKKSKKSKKKKSK